MRREPAVNHERGSRHVTGGRAGQEHEGRCELVRVTRPAGGHAWQLAVDVAIGELVGHLRREVTGIANDRPASVHDQCSDIPDVDQVTVPGVGEVCQSPVLQTRFATPRMQAGESITTDQEKCQLKPLRQSDYYPITFSDQEWAELEQIFPNGVCNWAKPGVDQQPTIPWQAYQHANGSVIYGGKPLGPAPANSGSGWTSRSFDQWLSQ